MNNWGTPVSGNIGVYHLLGDLEHQFFLFPEIVGISTLDEIICFGGVAQPPGDFFMVMLGILNI